MEFFRQDTGVGYHFLLRGIFLTQGFNPSLLCLLHRQVDSLLLALSAKPTVCFRDSWTQKFKRCCSTHSITFLGSFFFFFSHLASFSGHLSYHLVIKLPPFISLGLPHSYRDSRKKRKKHKPLSRNIHTWSPKWHWLTSFGFWSKSGTHHWIQEKENSNSLEWVKHSLVQRRRSLQLVAPHRSHIALGGTIPQRKVTQNMQKWQKGQISTWEP